MKSSPEFLRIDCLFAHTNSLSRMATPFTTPKLFKFLAVFLTVTMYFGCFSVSGARVGHYERNRSHVHNVPNNIDTTTHRHRYHKNAKARDTLRKHHLREEKDILSKEDKEREHKTSHEAEDILLQTSIDNIAKSKDIKEPQHVFHKEGSRHKTEQSFEKSIQQKAAVEQSKEEGISKQEERVILVKQNFQPEKNKDDEFSSEKAVFLPIKNKTSEFSSESFEKPKSYPVKNKDEKATLEILEKSTRSENPPENFEKPISKTAKNADAELSSEIFQNPKLHLTKTKDIEFFSENFEKPISQPAKKKDSEIFSETEELSYTDEAGEQHNVEGFFDENSTLSHVIDDFESMSNDSYHKSLDPGCPGCRLNREMRETIRENRKRALQQQILNALQMERPPNATVRRYPKVPALLELYEKSESLMMADEPSGGARKRDPFYGEEVESDEEPVQTKAVYIQAQPAPAELRLNISDGVFFTLPNQLWTSKIKRAHMWVYIKRPSTPLEQKYVELSISLIAPETKGSERIVQKPIEIKKINMGRKHKPWRQIDIKNILEFWTKRPDLNMGLQLKALDDNGNNLIVLPPDEEYAPLISATLGRTKLHSRHRRSVSLVCTEQSQESRCCRYPLEIGFVEMGWEWIIAPQRVDANYCAGECHMVMMDATPRSWIAQNMQVGTGSCCVATRMQPLSLLYFGDDQTILFQILQDVKVSTCGCV